MSNHAESLKVVADFLRNLAENYSTRDGNTKTSSTLDTFVIDLENARAEIIRLKGLTTALPPNLGEIHDLPQELLAELSVSKVDELDNQLVTVINVCGGTANLDQVLVGMYRKFQVKQKRRFLQNKLYRMESVRSVPGRKGLYTTRKATEEEQPADLEQEEQSPDLEQEILDLLGISHEDDAPF